MPRQMMTVSVDVPDGYELTGEYRCPSPGEKFLTGDNQVREIHENDIAGQRLHRFIVRCRRDVNRKWVLDVLETIATHGRATITSGSVNLLREIAEELGPSEIAAPAVSRRYMGTADPIEEYPF